MWLAQDVHKASDRCALKLIDSGNEKTNAMLYNFESLSKLDHPNIVKVDSFGRKGFIKKPNKATT